MSLISGQAISDGPLGGETEAEASLVGRRYHRLRARVRRNRYGDIGLEPEIPVVPVIPTPTYDNLPPDRRMTVDRMIVAARIKSMEIAL